jgi:hypothetical protein
MGATDDWQCEQTCISEKDKAKEKERLARRERESADPKTKSKRN